MRILHVSAGLSPGSGVAEVVTRLACHQVTLGHSLTIASLKGLESAGVQQAREGGVKVVLFGRLCSHVSPGMLFGLRRLMRQVNVVHLHGSWTYPIWVGCGCALASGKPYVVSPHGSFDPVRLRHSAWKKRLAGLMERYFLRRASVIHATSEAEAAWVRNYLRLDAADSTPDTRSATVCDQSCPNSRDSVSGRRAQPRIVVIPNGMDSCPWDGRRETRLRQHDSGQKEDGAPSNHEADGNVHRSPRNAQRATLNAQRDPHNDTHSHSQMVFTPSQTGVNEPVSDEERRVWTLLYLGRLHPLKGLDLLLEAWAVMRLNSAHLTGEGECGEFNAEAQRRGGECGEFNAEAQRRGGEREKNVQRATLNAQRSSTFDQQTPLQPHTRTECRWRLVIAGPDEQGTLAALERQARRLGLRLAACESEVSALSRDDTAANASGLNLDPTIFYAGPRYGEEKFRLLQEADLVVLPSRSENFGLVVAEALAAGVPVITTKAAPWGELVGGVGGGSGELGVARSEWGEGERFNAEAQRRGVAAAQLPNARTASCGWWVEVGVEPLAGALREAMALTDAERRIMGENGRHLVEAKYRWETVAERMVEVYRQVGVSREWWASIESNESTESNHSNHSIQSIQSN